MTICAATGNTGTKLSCNSHGSSREKIPVPVTGRHLGWNEEHFITVSDFVKNAPAVIRLEVARISAVLGRLEMGSDSYNQIVSARHRLSTLVSEIEGLQGDSLSQHFFELLEEAILYISIESASISAEKPDESEDLDYAANRLDYIIKQMRRLA